MFNNIVAGETYRGEHLGDLVAFMGAPAPDEHRELHRIHVVGNIVAVELEALVLGGVRGGQAEVVEEAADVGEFGIDLEPARRGLERAPDRYRPTPQPR